MVLILHHFCVRVRVPDSSSNFIANMLPTGLASSWSNHPLYHPFCFPLTVIPIYPYMIYTYIYIYIYMYNNSLKQWPLASYPASVCTATCTYWTRVGSPLFSYPASAFYVPRIPRGGYLTLAGKAPICCHRTLAKAEPESMYV